MGGCAASVWVPMVEVCQKYISPNHQGRALGLMSSGTSYGVFTNSILISFFLDNLGWRFIWIATFIIVALIYLCALFIFRAIERHEAEVDSQSTDAQATSIPFLEKIRNLPRKIYCNNYAYDVSQRPILHAIPDLFVFITGR